MKNLQSLSIEVWVKGPKIKKIAVTHMIFPSCIKRNEILRAPVYLKTKPEYAKWV